MGGRFMRYKKMIIFLAVTLGLPIALLFTRSISGSPVLFRVPDLHSIRGHPLILVLNPLRDKGPEMTANEFLEGLRKGQCVDLVDSFSREKSIEKKSIEICEKQSRYPLVEWKLLDLEEKNGEYSLAYEHRSKNAIATEDMQVWVKRNEQGWKVVDFIIGY